jgi:hypothetical protein
MFRFYSTVLLFTLLTMGLAQGSEKKDMPEQTVVSQTTLARSWVVNWMTRRVALDARTYYEDAEETPEERLSRYEEISAAVVDVAYDEDVRPLFRGANGRTKTAAFLLAIMYHESSFLKHVDLGIGKYAQGDAGKSWCMMQVMLSGEGKTMPWNVAEDRLPRQGDKKEDIFLGYTGPELIADRKACLLSGLRVLRVSLATCRANTLTHKLAAYTSGSCDKGLDASAVRVNTALRMYQITRSETAKISETDLMAEVRTRKNTTSKVKGSTET